jgi:hypothetical protein
MAGKADFLELFQHRTQRSPAVAPATTSAATPLPPESEAGECPAFGYLRGLDVRAVGVEFRFRDGNSEWHPYSHLASCRHNPSVGLLLKFTSDVTTLVLIRGSNLDALVGDQSINLTDRGFQRHRVLWVREMDEDEIRQVGKAGPTIDRFDVGEFETSAETREWLRKEAPVFLRS